MDFMRFLYYFVGMATCLLLFIFLNKQKPTGLIKSLQFGLVVLILIILVMLLILR